MTLPSMAESHYFRHAQPHRSELLPKAAHGVPILTKGRHQPRRAAFSMLYEGTYHAALSDIEAPALALLAPARASVMVAKKAASASEAE